MSPRLKTLLAVALPVILLDQASKLWLRDLLPAESDRMVLLPVLDLVHAWNPGVSFSMFADLPAGTGRWILIAVALGISTWLTRWSLNPSTDRWTAIGLAAIIGGALGNVIDRLIFGAVYDFLLLHYRGWSWPAFNIADTAITLGAAVLIWRIVFPAPQPVAGPAEASGGFSPASPTATLPPQDAA